MLNAVKMCESMQSKALTTAMLSLIYIELRSPNHAFEIPVFALKSLHILSFVSVSLVVLSLSSKRNGLLYWEKALSCRHY